MTTKLKINNKKIIFDISDFKLLKKLSAVRDIVNKTLIFDEIYELNFDINTDKVNIYYFLGAKKELYSRLLDTNDLIYYRKHNMTKIVKYLEIVDIYGKYTGAKIIAKMGDIFIFKIAYFNDCYFYDSIKEIIMGKNIKCLKFYYENITKKTEKNIFETLEVLTKEIVIEFFDLFKYKSSVGDIRNMIHLLDENFMIEFIKKYKIKIDLSYIYEALNDNKLILLKFLYDSLEYSYKNEELSFIVAEKSLNFLIYILTGNYIDNIVEIKKYEILNDFNICKKNKNIFKYVVRSGNLDAIKWLKIQKIKYEINDDILDDACYGSLEVVKYILKKTKYNIKIKNIITAIINDKFDIFKYLIKKLNSLTIKNNEDLILTCLNSKIKYIKYLIKHEFEINDSMIYYNDDKEKMIYLKNILKTINIDYIINIIKNKWNDMFNDFKLIFLSNIENLIKEIIKYDNQELLYMIQQERDIKHLLEKELIFDCLRNGSVKCLAYIIELNKDYKQIIKSCSNHIFDNGFRCIKFLREGKIIFLRNNEYINGLDFNDELNNYKPIKWGKNYLYKSTLLIKNNIDFVSYGIEGSFNIKKNKLEKSPIKHIQKSFNIIYKDNILNYDYNLINYVIDKNLPFEYKLIPTLAQILETNVPKYLLDPIYQHLKKLTITYMTE